MTRRTFVNWLLGGGLIAWAAAVVIPILRYLTPLQETGDVSEVELSAGDRSKILSEGFAIVRFGPDRVIVLKDARGKLRGLSAKCTHEGCTVTYRSHDEIVWCACHNGRFDINGRIISGPVPRPLAEYKVLGNLTGKVIVMSKEA